MRLALRLSREASEPASPTPAPSPAPANRGRRRAATTKREGSRKKKAAKAPAVEVAAVVVKRRRRPESAVGPLGGGRLNALPWELLWGVSTYLEFAAAAVWRGCGTDAARGVEALFGEDRVELARGGTLVATSRALRNGGDADAAVWEHAHNWRCEACGSGGDLLCCDYCNLVFHLRCLGLAEAPEGLWRCPECAADTAAPVIGATAAAARRPPADGKNGDASFVAVGGYHHASFTPNGDAYVCDAAGGRGAWRRETCGESPPAGVSCADCAVAGDGRVRAFARRGDGGEARREEGREGGGGAAEGRRDPGKSTSSQARH